MYNTKFSSFFTKVSYISLHSLIQDIAIVLYLNDGGLERKKQTNAFLIMINAFLEYFLIEI